MKLSVAFAFVSALAQAQSPDPFAGTWKLNARKSVFTVAEDTYMSGVRTYASTPDGERVTWTMVDAHGKESTGSYSVHCVGGECTSEVVRWRRKDPRTVEGEMIERGRVTQRYSRTVSPDGKVLIITFYKPKMNTPISRQVWEK